MKSSLARVSSIAVSTALAASILSFGINIPTTFARAALQAPTAVSPADGATLTSAQLDKVDWTDSESSFPPVTYTYEVSNSNATNPDGSLASPVYQASALPTSEIPTPGTPNGIYYWHVMAQDASASSTWSSLYSFTIADSTTTPPGDGGNGTTTPAQTCAFNSDETTQTGGHDSVVETPNPAWTSIPGSSWIWEDTLTDDEAASGTTATFTKAFDVTGATATGTIEIASDNGFILSVNGTQVADNSTVADNFSATKTYDISADLVQGNNSVVITVNNLPEPGETAQQNPAGLLYKLSVGGDTCGPSTTNPGGGEGNNGNNGDNGTLPPATCVAGQNLLSNASFEMPVISNASNWDVVPSGTAGFDWVVQWLGPALSGRPEVANAEIQHNYSGWPAADGSQWTELDSDWNGPQGPNGNPSSVSLSQTISTIPGDVYTFSFEFSPRPGTGAVENVVNALANGTVIGTASSTDPTPSSTVWVPETFTYVATSGQTTFTLADAGSPNDSFGPLVDNTSLTCAPAEVTPPPSCSIVSDSSTQEDGHDSAVLSFIHSSWTHLLDATGAKWIWGEDGVTDPVGDTTEVFTKVVHVTGTPTDASVDFATDNGYQVRVNGTLIADQINTEHNYEATTTLAIPAADLVPNADNTIEFTVHNLAMAGGTQQTNPAGLVYDIHIDGSTCSVPTQPPAPQTTSVKICKKDDNGDALAGWNLYLKGDHVEDLTVPTTDKNGIDTTSSLASTTSYLALANGTWSNQNGANLVDAEYSTIDDWATHMDGYTGYQTDILELQANQTFDPNSNWGTYNSDHQYALSFMQPNDGPANFRIFDGTGTTQNDSWFTDNSGTLNVSLYKGYAGQTDESGCVTFDNVPYGTYTAGETPQDGWTNVSGDGSSVTVNGDHQDQEVDIVNTQGNDNGGTPTGSIEISKYSCPAGTTVSRAANGVGGTVPEGCTPESGATFGYVHGTQTDANAPDPELSESLTAGGSTNGTGTLTIPNLPATGRYLVEETDANDARLPDNQVLGLYCTGDGDTTGTNDNQELTFVPNGGSTQCVAYDPATTNGGGDNGGTGGTSTTTQTIVVHQSDLASTTEVDTYANYPNEWFFANDQTDTLDNTEGSMVFGPDTPPLGSGSAEISVTSPSQGIFLGTYGFKGTALKDINTLQYSTYRSAGDPALALALQFDVNTTGTSSPAHYQGRLIYEPYYTHTVTDNSWQTWNPMDDATSSSGLGNWWFSHANNGSAGTVATTCTQATPCTWSQVLAQFPDIGISAVTDFKAGSNWSSSFTGDVDAFEIGIQNGTTTAITTYDFEPDPVVPHFQSFTSNGGGGGGGSSGQILGNSITLPPTGKVLGASCDMIVPNFLHIGWKQSASEVSALQQFLNQQLGLFIPVTGFFGPMTKAGVILFQLKYSQDTLAPWVGIPGSGISSTTDATGYVYKTTQWKVNMLNCPDLDLPFPTLP